MVVNSPENTCSQIRGGMNVNSLNNQITWNIPYLVGLTLQLVCTAAYLVRIQPVLGSTALLTYIAVKLILLRPVEKAQERSNKVTKKLDLLLQQILDDTLNMMTSIKLFSKETFHRKDYNASQQQKMDNLSEVVIFRCLEEFISGFMKVGIYSLILWLALSVLQDTSLGRGDLVAFFLLLPRFQDLVGRINWHYSHMLVREFTDIERFLSLMEVKPGQKEGTSRLGRQVRGEVEFKEVTFTYPSRPGEEVLQKLSLKLASGQVTAIVGDSGAGKSTVAKLLLRLYDPDSGTITIDGQDIRDVVMEDLHKHVSIVNQNPDLFNTSLRDNIGYGCVGTEEATDDEIEAAAKLANCGFISNFRGGLDTFAGSGGSGLSGGQKQRIAIARAAMRSPSILVLDEATSSLDTENEAQVQEALERLMRGRTTIVIAHRLSTIRSADEIVVLEAGKVVERGGHSELLQLGGVYKRLVNAQVDRAEEELQ